MPDSILTLPDVAVWMKTAEKTVYNLNWGGRVPEFISIGRWFFRPSALEILLTEPPAWFDGIVSKGDAH